MNTTLIAIPSPFEIREALFSINPDKAPGPDGFSASFYQNFWDILGEDVVKDIQAFFISN
uniref:Reverse transcriptase domain-containing protein n=1 Tax=Brassica oleracea var. oleracea TaxID=109376 RepID=A0A0D3AZ11_BRAOL